MNDDVIDMQSANGARVRVHRHGGHVLSWHPAGSGEDRLFMSRLSHAAPGVALRGGVPVVFPQFASRGPLPKHGFARILPWTLLSQTAPDSQSEQPAEAVLELRDSPATREYWPHAFRAEITITVGGSALDLRLMIENTGDQPFEFMAAFHTYFRVRQIGDVRITGLQGTRSGDFVSDPKNGVPDVERAAQLSIPHHFDSIFWDAPAQLLLEEPGNRLRISQSGFCDTVIWNPGPEHVHNFPDLEPADYLHLLCIEAALIGNPLTLLAGQRWSGRQNVQVG